jgi:exopolyphosphatase/guanosine-5'-triphosphate,3'-diphosphate pyrophosphatase
LRRIPGGKGPRRAPFGVIDIGSNSIRLVVYDALVQGALPAFNEKVLCGLGKDLEETGRIAETSADMAIDNLRRFAALAKAMGAKRLAVVGTAAVRDAENGPEFARRVVRQAGLRIRVLSGGEEAQLSALGVLSGMPDVEGAMGDLGGASIELVRLRRGRRRQHVTLPLGVLRLRAMAAHGRAHVIEEVGSQLGAVHWVDGVRGGEFVAVGGSWRAIARLHMAHVGYPLHVIHSYAINRDDAEDFLDLLWRQSRDSLERILPISRKRIESVPYAAFLLREVLRSMKPKRLVFSALGLREGILHELLPARERSADPLLAGIDNLLARSARGALDADALERWIRPVLSDFDRGLTRMTRAACALSDIAWLEHPDYRAELAYQRVLHMPFSALNHRERAFLALALHARYGGDSEDHQVAVARQLIDGERVRAAVTLGAVLRLAYTLCAGSAALLKRFRLSVREDVIRLHAPRSGAILLGEAVERRLATLGRVADRRVRLLT